MHLTADEARAALEQVIRSHTRNTLSLEAITQAWNQLDTTERMQLGTEYPELVNAIVKAAEQ